MQIIHQTAEYVVVCKAAGEDSEHDLPEMLAEQNGDRATDYYVVHRLDQAVAGLLVLARNRVTAAELSRQLTENRLRKTYLCVVPGVPVPASGEMQDLLYKDKMKKKMFPVKRKRAGVKEASLRYHVLETKLMNTTVMSSKQEDTAAVSASAHARRGGASDGTLPSDPLSVRVAEAATRRGWKVWLAGAESASRAVLPSAFVL